MLTKQRGHLSPCPFVLDIQEVYLVSARAVLPAVHLVPATTRDEGVLATMLAQAQVLHSQHRLSQL